MKKGIYLFLFAITVLFSCAESETVTPTLYGSITGTVVDKETQEPIADARVSTNPISETVFTNENGEFSLARVQTGNVSVEAFKNSYLTAFDAASVQEDQESNVIIEMEKETANNMAPDAPNLLTPVNDSTYTDLTVEMVWNKSTDREGDDVIYKLSFFEEGSSVIQEFDNLTDTTYTVENLNYGTRYYWQVAARDDINDGESSSEIFSFLTIPFPLNRLYFARVVDGNNVIYSTDAVATNPSLIQITETTANSWRPRKNPANDIIAFLRNVGTETHIFTMHPDGSNLTQVTDIPIAGFREGEIDFTWTNDGSKLLYPNFDKLYSVNIDGTGTQLHYTTPNGKLISEADWSADGSFFAVKVNDSNGYNVEIYTIDMDGNVLDTVLSGEPGAAGGLNISFDSNKILYTRDVSGVENPAYRQLDSHMFLYDRTDGSVFDVSQEKDDGFNDLDPRFSPNEAEIIFTYTSNDGISTRLINTIDVSTVIRKDGIIEGYMPDWE